MFYKLMTGALFSSLSNFLTISVKLIQLIKGWYDSIYYKKSYEHQHFKSTYLPTTNFCRFAGSKTKSIRSALSQGNQSECKMREILSCTYKNILIKIKTCLYTFSWATSSGYRHCFPEGIKFLTVSAGDLIGNMINYIRPMNFSQTKC